MPIIIEKPEVRDVENEHFPFLVTFLVCFVSRVVLL